MSLINTDIAIVIEVLFHYVFPYCVFPCSVTSLHPKLISHLKVFLFKESGHGR